ncbi:MAG: phosphate--acyl-ACP acyltransferase, partial [Taibaiella sp.]|nr:phosphate--acyl-ACP acyltransferase [Taibaiella sp.]
MKIAFDIMGGDYAPSEAIKGVQLFLDSNQDSHVHLLLIGTAEAGAQLAAALHAHAGRYTFIEASQVIGMSEHPTKALKEKQQSSIAIGFGLLQAKKADAFISAGNTGAMMVGAMYTVKNVPGVQRPTIASPVPQTGGNFNLLLDVG